MKKYLIERAIPGVDRLSAQDLKGAAATSNAALAKLGSEKVQWIQSFIAADKTMCLYLAEDEAAVRAHAELSGFPATRIMEVTGTIDPTTAG